MKIKVENMLQESLTGGIVMKGYVVTAGYMVDICCLQVKRIIRNIVSNSSVNHHNPAAYEWAWLNC